MDDDTDTRPSQLGGGGDDVSVLPLVDLRNKIELFTKLDDAVRKAARPGTREQGYRELSTVLGGAHAVSWIDDRFTSALQKYIEQVRDNAKRFVSGYAAFKAECDALLRNNVAVKPTEADLDSVVQQVSQLKVMLARYPDVLAAWESQKHLQGMPLPFGATRPDDPSVLRNQIVMAFTNMRIGSSVLQKVLKYSLGVQPASKAAALRQFMDTLNRFDVSRLNDNSMMLDTLLTTMVDHVEDARSHITSPTSTSTDAFDAAKSAAEDYIRYHKNPAGMPPGVQKTLLDGVIEALEQHATVMALYLDLGKGLVGTCRSVRESIEAWQKANPLPGASGAPGPGAAPPSPAVTHVHQLARPAVDALVAVETKLLMSVNDDKHIPELDELSRRLLVDPQFARTLAGRGGSRSRQRSSSDARSPSDDKGSADGGVLAGFLYRRVDPIRVARYLEQAERFRDAVINYKLADYVTMQITRMKALGGDMDRQVTAVGEREDAAEAVEPSEVALRASQLADEKVAASKSFVNGIRGNVASFVRMHQSFVTQRHGDAIRYMLYWKNVGEDAIDDDDVVKALDAHAELMTEIAAQARKRLLDDVRKPVLDAALEVFGTGKSPLKLSESQQATVDARIDALGRWIVEQSERVDDLYARGTPTLLDSLLDPQIIALYVLKALRVLIAALTLGVASNTFQGMYTHRVHTRDEPPPHPALFVAMLLGLDVAVHLLVLAVMLTLMRVFKTVDNDFPIDGPLVRLWLVDYAVATVAIGALSLIIGVVFRNKKYFRYKYEGDRGIRAMRDLVFYVYCVMAPIPFFRIVFG